MKNLMIRTVKKQPRAETEIEGYCDLGEIAHFLNTSSHTAYMWMKSGVIPAVKIRGTLRFKKSAVAKHVEANNPLALDKEGK